MEEILIKYFKGSCSSEEYKQAEAFKRENPKEFMLLEKLWANRAEVNLENFNADKAWTQVLAKIQPRAAVRIRPLYFQITKVAAVIILLVASTFLMVKLLKQDGPSMITLSGKQGPVILGDGSKIWLNRNATLVYPATFSDEQRKLTLTGEAFFEIAKDLERPFLVANGQVQVKVLGTSFNANMSDSLTQVSVATGRVEVSSFRTKNTVRLSPGEAASVTVDQLVKKEADPNFQSWKTGEFIFNNASVEEVLRQLKTYYTEGLPTEVPETDCGFTANIKNMNVEEVKLLISKVCEIELN